MPRRRVVRLALVGAAALVVMLVVTATAVATAYVRRPFPEQGGELEVSGLTGTVEVVRDERGVPSLYADTAEDLFRAQGFVHAQDRFFEMDWRRHVTAGRLSELVGPNEAALQADTVVRTLGWRRVAAAELAQADPTTHAWLDAYTAGVNAYLSSRSASELSLQYTLLGVGVDLPPIEPWTPEDSVAWFKAMAWDLRGNYDDELSRALAYAEVGDVDRVEQLHPSYPYGEHAPILARADVRTGKPESTSSDTASGTSPLVGAGAAVGAGADGTADAATASTATTTNGAEKATTTKKAKKAKAAKKAKKAKAADLVAAEDAEQVADLLRVGPVHAALASTREAVDAVPDLLGVGEGTGSNSWVVAGRLTATGKPLLANDPHLAPGLPGVWYQMGLHCRQVSESCPFDVSGFTFSGVPGVVIGHNGTIAWGMTNLGADVTDFYLEKVDGDQVERDGELEPMTVRTERIEVAGADPVGIQVRETSHGPVLSDVLEPLAALGDVGSPAAEPSPSGSASGQTSASASDSAEGAGYAVSLAWTALAPGHAMDALFALDTATDFTSFRQAALRLDSPAQNLLYADGLGVSGHIGYQAPGRIPLRRVVNRRDGDGGTVPTDGSWPLPGWNSRFDWRGFVPASRLPWTLDPERGLLVAANQAVTTVDGPVQFTTDFDAGYRSQRIRDLLAERGSDGRLVTVPDMLAIQGDTQHPMAEVLLPLLGEPSVDAFTEEARQLLRDWDGSQPADSAAAVYFNAVWASLLDLTFADELPEGTRPRGGSRWNAVVTALLERPRDRWWDDTRTPGVVETRDEMLRRSLVEARLRLTRQLGKDVRQWSWGRAHALDLVARPTGGMTGTTPLHRLLNAGPVALPGGPSSVDAMGWDATSGSFAVTWAPSMRMVVDLADPDASRWVNQTGQSGHPGHRNYTDQLDAWAEGETFAWPFSVDAVHAAARTTQLLRAPS